MIRFPTASALVVVALALAPGAAPASAAALGRLPLPIQPDGSRAAGVTGPLLAGDAVVVGVMDGVDGPARTWAVPATGGAPRALPGPLTLIGGGAAGVLVRATQEWAGGTSRYDSPYVARQTIFGGAVDGPSPALTSCVTPAAVDGARVAFVAAGAGPCDTLVVRDVLSGREVGRFPLWTGPAPLWMGRLELALTGDRVAWRTTGDLQVADLATGAVRTESWPEIPAGDASQPGVSVDQWALGADGRLAFRARSVGVTQIAVRPPGASGLGSELARDVSTAPSGGLVVGFSGPDVVVRSIGSFEGRTVDRVVLLHADGSPPRTLVTAAARGFGTTVTGQVLLGVDVEGERVAWALRDCDEVGVNAAAIADLPPGGVDVTAPEHCARPVLERTTVAVDRRGRGTIAFRCATACAGRMVLEGVETSSSGGEYRYLAIGPRGTFAFAAGRHRLALRLTAAQRAWLIATHGPKVRGTRRLQVALAGTTGGRPSARVAQVRVVARR